MAERAGVVPQLLGAAVGIVLGATLLFALLGMLRDDGSSPEIVAEPSPSASVDDAGEEPAPDATDDGTDGSDGSDEDGGDATTEPSPDATEETEEPSPEPTATEEPPAEVDPATVSIQVLDAVGGEDGPAASQAVADELREAGFDVIVVNRAGRLYDVTTVFWTAGEEAGGRQVAAALGTSAAEPTPEEVQLSDSVDVHVVVGSDRA